MADLEKRVQNKVIEPSNYALLKKLIEKAETSDEAIKIAELGTTYKRTGFHFDKRLEKTSDTISYFKRNKDLSFTQNPTDITHKLIIGDNYPALLNLLIQYRGKVDVIYIDPPYGKDSMGEYAQTNYENNITRDNLLSMLYPRLVLAKQLLSDSGIIFCSIDDRNQAYVKGLLDEVFEEKNFVNSIVWEANPGGDKGVMVETTKQFILMYANNKSILFGLELEQKKSEFNLQDKKGNYKKGGQLEKWGNADTIYTHPRLGYTIYYKEKTKEVKILSDYNKEELIKNKSSKMKYLPPDKELLKQGFIPIRPRVTQAGNPGRWRLEEKTFLSRFANNDFMFEINNGVGKIYEKNRFIPLKYKKMKDIIHSDIAKQTNDQKDIFGQQPLFDYPKPVALIRYLLSHYQREESVILDFFAGSGTTGQAVLELNKDGGKRRYICVQLNENLDKALEQDPTSLVIKAQISLCDKYHRPHELSEITAERLHRVMTGKCYDGSSDFEWNKKNTALGGNLDVYNIETVSNFETAPTKTAFDVIDETLYGQEKFATVQKKVEWVCANFEHAQKQLETKSC